MKKLLLATALLVALVAALSARQRVVGELDLFAVRSGSMGEAAPAGSLVTTRDASNVDVGDIITFELAGGDLLTHRVASVTGDGFTTQGDANDWRDPWVVRRDQVRGVVEDVYPSMGRALVYVTLPVGMASIASAMLTIVLAWRLFFPSEDERRRDLVPACVS